MKARIRKTGEIVNIAEYSKITLEQCDSWGNPIELKPEKIELIQEQTEDVRCQINDIIDWDYYRIHSAIAAMQGLMDLFVSLSYNKETIARIAVEQADALIAELKKK